MKNGMLALSLFALTVADSLAAEVGGIQIADKVTVGGQELVLNGAGVRTRLFQKFYIGALYLPRKSTNGRDIINGNEARRFMMALQRDLEAETLLEGLRAGLANNNSQAELDAVQPQIEQFLIVFKSVGEARAGQAITIDYSPADGTRVSLDGISKGGIAGEAFGKAIFKTWLGEKPVQESMKRALLGAVRVVD